MTTTTADFSTRTICPRCDAYSLPGTIACPYCHYEFRFEWTIPTTTAQHTTEVLIMHEKPDTRSLRASSFIVSFLSFIAGMVVLALLQSTLRP